MKTVKIKVGELEKAEDDGLLDKKLDEEGAPVPSGASTKIDSLGLSLDSITAQDRQAYKIGDDVTGVIVTDAKELSEAAEKGLAAGDVIVEINQQIITDPKGAKDIIDKAAKAGRNSVLLLVNREGDVRFVALRLKK